MSLMLINDLEALIETDYDSFGKILFQRFVQN